MKKQLDPQFRRDLVKLTCLIAALIGTAAVFIVTPALSSPTVLSLVAATLLSPAVSAIERRGYSRTRSILILFFLLTLAGMSLGIWGIKSGISEWNELKETAPTHFTASLQKLRVFELDLKSRYHFLESIHPTDKLLQWGRDIGAWFVDHGPGLMGELLTWLFIIPPLTFVLLNEGPVIRRRFFQLVPNRYFESCFLITSQITNAISDYIRAKLVEALLVGLMVTGGLALVKAPYVLALGLIAGVTNIIPYLGPFLGAIPAIMIIALDPSQSANPLGLLPLVTVYVIANVIDTIVIFPLVVAKLVKLHPLVLIAVVIVGQHYYGLIGMLISIPIATALKVVFHEIYIAVYEQKPSQFTESTSEETETLESVAL